MEPIESKNVERLPVVRNEKLVGIATRSSLLPAAATWVREIPDPAADGDHVRRRIIDMIEKTDWTPFGLGVTVRGRIVTIYGSSRTIDLDKPLSSLLRTYRA